MLFSVNCGSVRWRGPDREDQTARGYLDVETEIDDVAVLHDVFFAFETGEAFFAGGLAAAAGDQIIVANDLGTDKAAFDVGVDLAGCLRCLGADRDGPGTDLFFTGGQERHQPEHVVGGLDQLIDTARGQPEVFQVFVAFCRVECDELRLELGADDDDVGLFACGVLH